MNDYLTLNDFLVDLAKRAIQQPNIYLSPGHNGPYHDAETPVRNYGHWLITFAKCHEWSKEAVFKNKAVELADYLCSEKSRPHGYSFHHRNTIDKDKCNGLIGQAWTFEALAEASHLSNDPQYAHLAEDVFFQHPFDEKSGVWNRLEINGDILPFDTAFNHQLWFAACAALLPALRRDEILRRVYVFLDRIDQNLTVLPNGLLYHPIEPLLKQQLDEQFIFKNRAKKQLKNLLRALKHLRFPEMIESEIVIKKRLRENFTYKSIGYYAFNMYAFALLKPHTKDHSFWNSDRFMQMLAYMKTVDFSEGLKNNNYGYPYNPPGFEVPYSYYILGDISKDKLIKLTSLWANEQLSRCFNPKTGMMDKNTEDPITHTARIYEIVRMSYKIIEKIKINQSNFSY